MYLKSLDEYFYNLFQKNKNCVIIVNEVIIKQIGSQTMPQSHKKLLELLKTLKEKYHAIGIKLELETEIISTKEIDFAQELAEESELKLVLKTSGGSAVSDIFLSKALNIKYILAPMIESKYALEKFYKNVKNICQNQQKYLLFNIETITAFQNIDEILNSKYINNFSGIVFGRNDFCCSLEKNIEFCDNEEISEYIKIILEKIENKNLTLTIGGNISPNSKSFFKKINNDKFTNIETRKIIFDKKILEADFEHALKTAIDFEQLWLESKSFTNPLDKERIEVLKKRMLR